MKTQIDKTQEQQSTAVLKVQKEQSMGGTATITDNRPSTVYQRKLRETMNAHAASKASPTQRQAPKGSSRFQQIATAMGEQHGVDTSGLAATHNSSFPGKLNAEATIQGNKIHFAPGMDTNYNMRHEVAHAIDNTLNGIPKGDRVVNGQKIDTTREKVVDKMARDPVSTLPNPSVSVQRKSLIDSSSAANTAPIQRTVGHANMIRRMCAGKTESGVPLNPSPGYTNMQDVINDRTAGNISNNIAGLITRAMHLDVSGREAAFDSQGDQLPSYDPNNASIQKGNNLLNFLENNHTNHFNFLDTIVGKITRDFGISALLEFWNGGHIVFNDNGRFYQRLIALGQPLAVRQNGNIMPKNALAGMTSTHLNYLRTAMRNRQLTDPNSDARLQGAMMVRRPQHSETSHYPGNQTNYQNIPAGVPNPPPQYGVDMPLRGRFGTSGEHVLFGLTYNGQTFVQTEGAGFQNLFQGGVMHLAGGIKNIAGTALNRAAGRELIKTQTGMFGSSNLSEKGTTPRVLEEAVNNTRQDTFVKIVNDLLYMAH